MNIHQNIQPHILKRLVFMFDVWLVISGGPLAQKIGGFFPGFRAG
jgi:hypothetical protein